MRPCARSGPSSGPIVTISIIINSIILNIISIAIITLTIIIIINIIVIATIIIMPCARSGPYSGPRTRASSRRSPRGSLA